MENTSRTKSIFILIQRDEIYKINFFEPIGTVTWKTPQEQKAYSFYCKPISGTAFGTANVPNKAEYCNYLDPVVRQQLADTLVTP